LYEETLAQSRWAARENISVLNSLSLSLSFSLFVGVGVSASINIANIHPYSLATER